MGIMLYHYTLWTTGVESASNIFTRIGVYGVSIFYILSGLTLYLVNYNTAPSNWSLSFFYVKRATRIFPLLWIATAASVAISARSPTPEALFSNFSGIFAFYKWDETIAYGAWSIGNELAFYLVFPILLFATKKSNLLFYIFLILSFTVYTFFAFTVLQRSVPFMEQWKSYTNPLNQVFLFISGVWIGIVFKNIRINSWAIITVFIASILLFAFYPVFGDRILLITNSNRLILTLSLLGICIAFYKIQFNLPGFIDNLLLKLGHSCYSLYLLHPIIYKSGIKFFTIWAIYLFPVPHIVVLIITGLTTILISYLMYYYFERFFIHKQRQMKIHQLLWKRWKSGNRSKGDPKD